MTTRNPVSPVIIRPKAWPEMRLVVVENDSKISCAACALWGLDCFRLDGLDGCSDGDYHYEHAEVKHDICPDARALQFAAAIEARVLGKSLEAIDAIIRTGELPEPQHSERNGMVLAYNAIAAMQTQAPTGA